MNEENNEFNITADEQENNTEKKPVNVGKEIWEWVYTLAIAVAIALLIKTFLFDVVRVDGSSMYPTLVNNDRLIVTKLAYNPKQGDIIILDSTYKKREAFYDAIAEGNGKEELGFFEKLSAKRDLPDELKKIYYVKRIIALPGQTVDLREDGSVYVDGKLLDELYYTGETRSTDDAVEYPLTVEDGTVFVMGDNRAHSKDSRSSELGLVPEDAILGRAQIRIWPFSSISVTR